MSLYSLLFILLALDDAAGFHGELSFNAAAVVALVLAIIAVVLELRGRVP